MPIESPKEIQVTTVDLFGMTQKKSSALVKIVGLEEFPPKTGSKQVPKYLLLPNSGRNLSLVHFYINVDGDDLENDRGHAHANPQLNGKLHPPSHVADSIVVDHQRCPPR